MSTAGNRESVLYQEDDPRTLSLSTLVLEDSAPSPCSEDEVLSATDPMKLGVRQSASSIELSRTGITAPPLPMAVSGTAADSGLVPSGSMGAVVIGRRNFSSLSRFS